MTGRLITLEGLDGVGKSTQAALLRDYCEGRGWQPLLLREPGGTALGEELRRLLKSGQAHSHSAELLLFGAARAELLHELVRPALADGRCVILDRFSDSTLAYQGALNYFDEQALVAVARLAAGGLVPDLTLLLDLEESAALQRRSAANSAAAGSPEGLDAIEQRNLIYFQRVRQRYLALWQQEPQRIVKIDAGQDIDAMAQQIRAALEAKWPI
ncbi:dTMP kinase [bacterium]|nr:dTMP kinase [bacterium]